MNIDPWELDRYITGNWGEDQLHEEAEPEFYGPWRVTNHKKAITVSNIITVVWDDNGNPMCYAEDDHFLRTAVERINQWEEQRATIEKLQDERDTARLDADRWERRARELESQCADRL